MVDKEKRFEIEEERAKELRDDIKDRVKENGLTADLNLEEVAETEDEKLYMMYYRGVLDVKVHSVSNYLLGKSSGEQTLCQFMHGIGSELVKEIMDDIKDMIQESEEQIKDTNDILYR